MTNDTSLTAPILGERITTNERLEQMPDGTVVEYLPPNSENSVKARWVKVEGKWTLLGQVGGVTTHEPGYVGALIPTTGAPFAVVALPHHHVGQTLNAVHPANLEEGTKLRYSGPHGHHNIDLTFWHKEPNHLVAYNRQGSIGYVPIGGVAREHFTVISVPHVREDHPLIDDDRFTESPPCQNFSRAGLPRVGERVSIFGEDGDKFPVGTIVQIGDMREYREKVGHRLWALTDDGRLSGVSDTAHYTLTSYPEAQPALIDESDSMFLNLPQVGTNVTIKPEQAAFPVGTIVSYAEGMDHRIKTADGWALCYSNGDRKERPCLEQVSSNSIYIVASYPESAAPESASAEEVKPLLPPVGSIVKIRPESADFPVGTVVEKANWQGRRRTKTEDGKWALPGGSDRGYTGADYRVISYPEAQPVELQSTEEVTPGTETLVHFRKRVRVVLEAVLSGADEDEVDKGEVLASLDRLGFTEFEPELGDPVCIGSDAFGSINLGALVYEGDLFPPKPEHIWVVGHDDEVSPLIQMHQPSPDSNEVLHLLSHRGYSQRTSPLGRVVQQDTQRDINSLTEALVKEGRRLCVKQGWCGVYESTMQMLGIDPGDRDERQQTAVEVQVRTNTGVTLTYSTDVDHPAGTSAVEAVDMTVARLQLSQKGIAYDGEASIEVRLPF